VTPGSTKLAVLIARLGYVVVLAAATLAPFHFALPTAGLARGLANAFMFRYSAATAVDAVQNVLLFAGWGALWVTTSRPLPLGASIRTPALSGAAMSVLAEGLQLFLPDRRCSVLDVMTNTAGAALGAASIAIAVQTARAMRTQKSYVGLPAAAFAIAYLCAAASEAVLPLQSAAVIATRGGDQLHRLHTAVSRLDWTSLWRVPLGDVLLFIPLGVFGVMALAEGGARHWAAVRRVCAWGAIGSVLLELTHGPLGQAIQLGTAVAHLIGIALGAVVCGAWLPAFSRLVRGRGRPAILLLAYALLIAFWAWRPFVIETNPATIHQQFALERLIPLQGLASRSDLSSVAEIVKPFFLFFPLGALLAVWPLARRGPLASCLPACYLAIVTEVMQGFIAGRFFDGTDLVIQCAAAAIGWAVARQAGYQPYGAVLGG
jgi:glycopeptide antibiotics resistance protein